ncbi:FEKKY domain-containing protein [Rufibacter tibetensis]|uniref:Uncharacterized protein n=1 Tax=Rufibacter tibetensis TaxID=512763 RepID=A0A0P0CT90_9BACT|nr:hypothetical protein [Rufibacter tibetensis]ALJ00736.1 hypothetical protein DC20_19320 [Rufibacter tibetensis]
MKYLFLAGLLILISFVGFGQSRKLTDADINNSGAIKLVFVTTVDEARELADKDIKNDVPFLLLRSGIAPVVYSTDSTFERKYNVFYLEDGCTGPEYTLTEEYNFVILDHLQKAYGNDWKRKVRKDVMGYKNWRSKK